MGSKTLVFLGLFVAMVLLISSEVAARELAETTNAVDTAGETEATEVGDQYGGGYGGRGGYGGGRGGYGGGGYGGGRGGYGGGRGGYGGGGYGGGRGGYGGGGGRGGYGGGRGGYGRGGGGGGCPYGRCGYGCCRYAGEAVDPDFVEAETHN